MGAPRPQVPPDILAPLRTAGLRLPEAYEEPAWVGVRWRVRGKTFAHGLMISDGWPPAYARAARTEGPACVLTFRSWGPAVDAESFTRAPFFKPAWRPDIVGRFLAADDDWDEIGRLVAGSYRILAPKRLVERLDGMTPFSAG